MEKNFIGRKRMPDPPSTKYSTLFYRKSIPIIPFEEYIDRLIKYLEVLEPIVLVVFIIYASRLDPPPPSGGGDGVCSKVILKIDKFSIHRFIIASTLLSSKIFSDFVYPIEFYAMVGGISVREMVRLEEELASLLDWNLFCKQEELLKIWKSLYSPKENLSHLTPSP